MEGSLWACRDPTKQSRDSEGRVAARMWGKAELWSWTEETLSAGGLEQPPLFTGCLEQRSEGGEGSVCRFARPFQVFPTLLAP